MHECGTECPLKGETTRLGYNWDPRYHQSKKGEGTTARARTGLIPALDDDDARAGRAEDWPGLKPFAALGRFWYCFPNGKVGD